MNIKQKAKLKIKKYKDIITNKNSQIELLDNKNVLKKINLC